jgi:hypothetical protein
MIIGNGMIAQACATLASRKDLIIFASGVSDSSETGTEPYLRETALLDKYLNAAAGRTLIYFSTCSVSDPEQRSKPYQQFKLRIEEHILTYAPHSALIIRLPQVMGHPARAAQLGGALLHCLQTHNVFLVHRLACRYLFYAGDIPLAIECLTGKSGMTGVINVAHNNCLQMLQIAEIFKRLTGGVMQVQTIEKGTCCEIDNANFLKRTAARHAEFLVQPDKIISRFLLDNGINMKGDDIR